MTALDHAPSHWKRTTIGEIAEVRLGRQRSPKNHSGEHMEPYLRAANVDWYGVRPDDIQEMNFTSDEMQTYALRENDILVVEGSGSATEVGKAALVPARFAGHAFQNTLIRVRPGDDIDPKWLMYRINAEAALGGFLKLARGVGIFHLGSTRTAAWPIAVPPLDEQRVIVEVIGRLLTRTDVAITSVVSALDRIGALREKDTRAAVYGTYSWQVPTPSVTGLAQETKERPAGQVEAAPPEEIFLPPDWRWVSLDELAEVQSGVAKNRKHAGAEGYVERPYLSVANVQRGFLDLRETGTVWVREAKLPDVLLQPGDVLFNEGGDKDKLGRGWVWQGAIANCVHQNHVFRARPRFEWIEPRWLSHWGNTFGRWWFYSRASQTTGIASINKTVLRSLPVAVPPHAEQLRLLEVLDRHAVVYDKLTAWISDVEAQAVTLRRSILKAAFEGRLSSGSRSALSESEVA